MRRASQEGRLRRVPSIGLRPHHRAMFTRRGSNERESRRPHARSPVSPRHQIRRTMGPTRPHPITGSAACPHTPFAFFAPPPPCLVVALTSAPARAVELLSSHSHQHSPTHAGLRGARMAATEPFSIRYARAPNFSVSVRLALPPFSVFARTTRKLASHD
jgi:hypothetical protein